MVDEALLPSAAACEAALAYVAAGRTVAKESGDRLANSLRARHYGSKSLAAKYPKVAQEWHPALNGDLSPEQVTGVSGKQVWWLCSAGHVWQARIDQRTAKGTGCGFCSGRYATEATSLATLRPDLAAQWHSTLNGDLTPDQVTPHTRRVVWWLCPAGHAVEDAVANRAKGMVCQLCPNARRGRSDPEDD
ncbi:zinc-ribbon domain-containing protein [Streptomyces sp. CA-288835]|uniref:zinc-ribbon domain-containing protein n=1 Tax=Streptomyces sp. CA-288835 TaxID=3240069 RepID=UPI003D8AC00F